MARYDLLVKNGTLVDGTGLSRRIADVAVAEGRVAEIGTVPEGEAARVIDAEGLVVAPGIVDLHTHYDPQLTFDPCATSSCYHGVTSVLAGNCGFAIAPTRADDRAYVTRLFARVEGMSPVALSGVDWRFESFPEYLAALSGQIGVNAAFYVGHSSLRRYVMGEAATRREATAAELHAMRALLREAMAAGAAGFSSSHGPTQFDGEGDPVPSRLASREELLALATETGRANAGSISYLPESAVGGLQREDEELLIELGCRSRLPIVIQGLGGRSKTDAPSETDWPDAQRFLAEAAQRGAAVFSLLRTQPFSRSFTLEGGTALYDGVPSWARILSPSSGLDAEAKRRALRDPAVRDAMRLAVENPNRDPARGNTLPPPPFADVLVNRVAKPHHEKHLGRSIAEIAAEHDRAPADVMLDLALGEDLATGFLWSSENPTWVKAVAEAQHHPSMLMGVSDGGAHLDRDDSSDWSTYFLARWVLERGEWTLEEGIRQLTQVPAALAGFHDRGLLLPGYAADLAVFDLAELGPGTKQVVHDFPGGEGRFSARPRGVRYTIVNGVPIVVDGELTGEAPGQLLCPGRRA